MGVDKDKVRDIVGVFYQAPFKVFNVNTEDGKSFSSITGVFVSLGLTTPLQTLEEIRNILNNTKGHKARLAELKSTRYYGQFLNQITEKSEEEIKPYKLDTPEDSFDERQTEELLAEMINKCKSSQNDLNNEIGEITQNILKIKELQNLINSTPGGGWSDSVIFRKSSGEFKIFRKTSNYHQLDDNINYRIGIYVEKI